MTMPTIMYTRSLAAHVAHFRAAVSDTSGKNPHEALSLLDGDAVAQIMSFVPFVKERCCLGALSPQMRLDSELGTEGSYIRYSEPKSRVSFCPSESGDAVADEVPFFSIVTSEEHSTRQRIVLSLWWASRCGLPVELSISSDDFEMVAHLNGTLGSRVKWLTVTIPSPPAIAAHKAAVQNSERCATVFASLPSFPNLQKLAIVNEKHQVNMPMSAELLSALKAASSLPRAPSRAGWRMPLHPLEVVTSCKLLRVLTIHNSDLPSLGGLSDCLELETLAVWDCPHITSVSALAGLSRLRAVTLFRCDLRSLDGLDRCMTLTHLMITGNSSLQSLSPLDGAPLLQTVVADRCDIRSAQGLGSCTALTEILLNDNYRLQSLGDLSNAPRLERVGATACDLRVVGMAGTWPALREINVGYNRNLQSLSDLSAAPLLCKIHAVACDVRSVEGLGSCLALSEIIVHGNRHLQSLGDLSRAPRLKNVQAIRCDLRDLGEAGPWSAVQKMNVSGNSNLQSLSGLSGAPQLYEVDARDCRVHDFSVLETCPNLRSVGSTVASR